MERLLAVASEVKSSAGGMLVEVDPRGGGGGSCGGSTITKGEKKLRAFLPYIETKGQRAGSVGLVDVILIGC
jgi:hypothetical protein